MSKQKKYLYLFIFIFIFAARLAYSPTGRTIGTEHFKDGIQGLWPVLVENLFDPTNGGRVDQLSIGLTLEMAFKSYRDSLGDPNTLQLRVLEAIAYEPESIDVPFPGSDEVDRILQGKGIYNTEYWYYAKSALLQMLVRDMLVSIKAQTWETLFYTYHKVGIESVDCSVDSAEQKYFLSMHDSFLEASEYEIHRNRMEQGFDKAFERVQGDFHGDTSFLSELWNKLYERGVRPQYVLDSIYTDIHEFIKGRMGDFIDEHSERDKVREVRFTPGELADALSADIESIRQEFGIDQLKYELFLARIIDTRNGEYPFSVITTEDNSFLKECGFDLNEASRLSLVRIIENAAAIQEAQSVVWRSIFHFYANLKNQGSAVSIEDDPRNLLLLRIESALREACNPKEQTGKPEVPENVNEAMQRAVEGKSGIKNSILLELMSTFEHEGLIFKVADASEEQKQVIVETVTPDLGNEKLLKAAKKLKTKFGKVIYEVLHGKKRNLSTENAIKFLIEGFGTHISDIQDTAALEPHETELLLRNIMRSRRNYSVVSDLIEEINIQRLNSSAIVILAYSPAIYLHCFDTILNRIGANTSADTWVDIAMTYIELMELTLIQRLRDATRERLKSITQSMRESILKAIESGNYKKPAYLKRGFNSVYFDALRDAGFDPAKMNPNIGYLESLEYYLRTKGFTLDGQLGEARALTKPERAVDFVRNRLSFMILEEMSGWNTPDGLIKLAFEQLNVARALLHMDAVGFEHAVVELFKVESFYESETNRMGIFERNFYENAIKKLSIGGFNFTDYLASSATKLINLMLSFSDPCPEAWRASFLYYDVAVSLPGNEAQVQEIDSMIEQNLRRVSKFRKAENAIIGFGQAMEYLNPKSHNIVEYAGKIAKSVDISLLKAVKRAGGLIGDYASAMAFERGVSLDVSALALLKTEFRGWVARSEIDKMERLSRSGNPADAIELVVAVKNACRVKTAEIKSRIRSGRGAKR